MGPDFTAPKTAAPAHLLRDDRPQQTPSRIAEGMEMRPDWWSMLGDPLLDKLVAHIATQNLDVLTATARLQESRAERGIVAADLFPQINGDALYTRQKISDKGEISLLEGSGNSATGGSSSSAASGSSAGIPSMGATPPFNVYQYGFDASWEIDLWGKVRRGVESANATTDANKEARRETVLSDTAELVSDYIQLRGVQANIQLAREALAVAKQIAGLAAERARGGLGNSLDVANARAQAATVNAQLPQLMQQQTQLMNAMALLLGQPPGALEAELATAKPIPPPPPQVPVGLPSELARRRPDVREAEARLHAATAQIGVAKADFFPQVTLMGNGDLQALDFSQLNSWAARTYSFGPSITLPIFQGGRLVSTLDLRKAQTREAALQYRKTLLTAFHEVDNALTAYRAEQLRHDALLAAVKQNRQALHLSLELYREGLSTFLDVLNSERSLLDTRQQSITSLQTESTNMVQLYKALGGGWEVSFPERGK